MKEINKTQISRGDFVFIRPRKTNIFQKIIAFFDGKYFHCGIMLSHKLFLSMTIFGLKIQPLEDYKGCKIDIFRLEDNSKIEELVSFYLTCFQYKYDFWGVVSFVFQFVRESTNRFFCSEFLALGLFYIGYLPERLQLSPLQLSNQDFLVLTDKDITVTS